MENAAQTTLLANTKHASAQLGHVLVLGLGVSGTAVRAYCQALFDAAASANADSLANATASLQASDSTSSRLTALSVLIGTDETGFDLETTTPTGTTKQHFATLAGMVEQVGKAFDLCIASPGISQFSPLYETAASLSKETISEVEFAWRESTADSKWVAITGTNGKTTTTALVAHLLRESGMKAAAIGNIGDACITAVAQGETEIYVAEVSSYQLASCTLFAPDCALLLNITPDHLAWHKSFEVYVEAKGNIFANLRACAECSAIIDATNEVSRGFVKTLREEGRCAYVPVGTAEGIGGDMRNRCGSANAAFWREDGMLVVALNGTEYELVHANELLIEGEHNINNALMAASAALCMHAPVEALRQGLMNFAPLEHRLEPCGSVGGVACYNDSKATNPEASLVALHALDYKRPIVLLGGDDKGTSLTELASYAAQTCQAAVCFGAAGPRFADAIAQTALPYKLVGNMEEALDAALGMAQAGGTVLLSPACASFDEFDNFEHRGRVFKQLVAARQAQ